MLIQNCVSSVSISFTLYCHADHADWDDDHHKPGAWVLDGWGWYSPSQDEGSRQEPHATPESSVTPPEHSKHQCQNNHDNSSSSLSSHKTTLTIPVVVLSPGPSLMQATSPPPTLRGPPVKFNLERLVSISIRIRIVIIIQIRSQTDP